MSNTAFDGFEVELAFAI
jgi:hypothetical protein